MIHGVGGLSKLSSRRGQGPEQARCDVLVIGSSLGSLAAAAFLARAGLRVTLLEEDVHAKRPPLLREPFALTGLGPGEPIDLLLRDLNVPLIERRSLRSDSLALQAVLPGARLDLGGGRPALARELETYGVCDRADALEWFALVDAAGDEERARLLTTDPLTEGAGVHAAEPSRHPLSSPPPGLNRLVYALLSALGSRQVPHMNPATALLLRSVRDEAFGTTDGSHRFLDVFRRRLRALYGEIRQVGQFGLTTTRREVCCDLGDTHLYAQACLVGVARQPLARALAEVGPPLEWLEEGAPPPVPQPLFLLRADARAMPVGMGSRLVSGAGESPEDVFWLFRVPDPKDPKVEWIVLRGPGAERGAHEAPLGELVPFSRGAIEPVEIGPAPRWDLATSNARFPSARVPIVLKRRPLVLCVGPEVAPDLGVEGELLMARQVAERLADRLGAERRPLRAPWADH